MYNDKRQTLYKAIISRILESAGKASNEKRREAFENSVLNEPLSNLINKVALHPTKITDEDIEKIIAYGYSEDQIFELIICAAVGESSRQYEAATNALTEAVNNK